MKQIIVNNISTWYYITEDGKCYNSKTDNYLKGQVNYKNGYLSYNITLPDGSKKRLYAHRLVAENYLEQPLNKNKNQVNHIDGNKLNNISDNLEWVTPKENIRHAIENDLSSIKYGSKNLSSKLKEEDVKYIRENAGINKSVKELSEIYNVSTTTIYNIINYKKWLKM